MDDKQNKPEFLYFKTLEDGSSENYYREPDPPRMRPIRIIHYFDQFANYKETCYVICLQELIRIEKYPRFENEWPRFFWRDYGNPVKTIIDINNFTHPNNVANNIFWDAVKDCFIQRAPRIRVRIDSLRLGYNVAVQYLVKEKSTPKTAIKTFIDYLAP